MEHLMRGNRGRRSERNMMDSGCTKSLRKRDVWDNLKNEKTASGCITVFYEGFGSCNQINMRTEEVIDNGKNDARESKTKE